MRVVRDIRVALGLLTAVPMGDVAPVPDRGGSVAAWFPVVGAALGAVVAGLVWGLDVVSAQWGSGALLTRASGLIAVVAIALWALATRLLHWDGLADVGDALWASDQARRLEIMTDSRVGAFGAFSMVAVAALQISAVAVLLEAGVTQAVLALALAPVVGRMSATISCWLGVPARPGGLGAAFVGRPRATDLLLVALVLAACVAASYLLGGALALLWLALSLFAAAAIPHLLAGRFGGVTGDVLGAGILLTEAVALALAALFAVW